MGIEDIRPGMRGYGKTVFSGAEIETFDVEILGVLKNYEAKSDMILVQLSGPVIEKTGIISGMSGSPIYIDDKIIGALSYAWPFSKDPVAGVTPISDMLKVLDKDLLPDGKKDEFTPVISKANPSKTALEGALTPIKTPLMVSGFNNRVFDIMGSELAAFGMIPIQSGGTIDVNLDDEGNLMPGSAVAVQLIRGDMNASAIGTVTYRKGAHILAFGHPFLQMGDIDLAMSGAYVHTTLASHELSAKMASPTKMVGRISQDRRAAVAGIIGEFAKMIPCHVKIIGTDETVYDFEIVHNDLFTTNLCQMAFLSAILATEKQLGEIFVKFGIKIFIDEMKEPITIENIYYDSSSGLYPIMQITQPIMELLNNRFKRVRIERIEFDAQLIDKPKIAFIEEIRLDKNVVYPGDTVNVSVKLNPYNMNKSLEKAVDIGIPNDILPGSKILVTACSSNHSRLLDRERSPGKYKPSNFKQMIDLIKNVELNNELIIRVLLPKNGFSLGGMQFPSLPSSVLSIMAWPNYSGTEMLFTEDIYRIKTDCILEGDQSLLLISKER